MQPPDEPTRRFPPARPIATEREVVRAAPENSLWVEVLDRLSSIRAGLVVVALLAIAALGVALWTLLEDADDPNPQGASPVRVERLSDRVDRLESQVGGAASESDVAAFRDRQQALERRLQTLEATVDDSAVAGDDVEQIATDLQALQDSVQALEHRMDALELQP